MEEMIPVLYDEKLTETVFQKAKESDCILSSIKTLINWHSKAISANANQNSFDIGKIYYELAHYIVKAVKKRTKLEEISKLFQRDEESKEDNDFLSISQQIAQELLVRSKKISKDAFGNQEATLETRFEACRLLVEVLRTEGKLFMSFRSWIPAVKFFESALKLMNGVTVECPEASMKVAQVKFLMAVSWILGEGEKSKEMALDQIERAVLILKKNLKEPDQGILPSDTEETVKIKKKLAKYTRLQEKIKSNEEDFESQESLSNITSLQNMEMILAEESRLQCCSEPTTPLKCQDSTQRSSDGSSRGLFRSRESARKRNLVASREKMLGSSAKKRKIKVPDYFDDVLGEKNDWTGIKKKKY